MFHDMLHLHDAATCSKCWLSHTTVFTPCQVMIIVRAVIMIVR